MADLQRLDQIRDVVGRAFLEDPLAAWIFPDEATRRICVTAFFGSLIEGYMRSGQHIDVVEEDGQVVAAAVWRIPNDAVIDWQVAPSVGELLFALIGNRAETLGPAFGEFANHWPPAPFAYLHLLAVHPEHQGRGLGRRVIEPGIAAAREHGLLCGLETTNPRNHSFYRSVGFNDVATFHVADDAPTATAMRLR
jgi:ribosomal protein S18 acetylase RimI-like enzyme